MDEKERLIQDLRRRNLALLAELHTIKECFTCSHYDEKTEHCEQFMFGYSCKDFDYEWRGYEKAEEWHEEQENIRQTELRLQAISEAEEDEFERRMGETCH